MNAPAAGSIGASTRQALSFGWNVLIASRTAFTSQGKGAGFLWMLGLGLLIFLVSSESSALGLRTRAHQAAFLALIWGPMTLGFLVAYGLRALSKPTSMALQPSLKGRATQAVLGFALLAASMGAATAVFAQAYGAFNGAIYALGSYAVVLGLCIPGRPDWGSLLILLVVVLGGRAEIVSIVRGSEVPSFAESLLVLAVFLAVLPLALWLFRPREKAAQEHETKRSRDAPPAGLNADADRNLAAMANASASTRLQQASQFQRQTQGLELKAVLIFVACGLLSFAFIYFFKGGKMPSARATCLVSFMMLMIPIIGSTSQHLRAPVAAFSRATLAEHCFRSLLRYTGACLAVVAVTASLLGGLLAYAQGGTYEDWTFVLPVSSLYVLPALPWAIALALFVQSSRFVSRWSIPGLEMACSVAGPSLAQVVFMFFILFATDHAVSLLSTGGPSKALWLVSAAALGCGLLAMRAGFRRYYAHASLEPIG